MKRSHDIIKYFEDNHLILHPTRSEDLKTSDDVLKENGKVDWSTFDWIKFNVWFSMLAMDHYPEFRENIETLDIPKQAKILDVGCGGGLLGRVFLDPKFDAKTIIGIDKEEVVNFAREIPIDDMDREKIEFVAQDLEENADLPFTNQSFDMIFVGNGTKVMFTDKLIAEYKRILRPGGMILILMISDFGNLYKWEPQWRRYLTYLSVKNNLDRLIENLFQKPDDNWHRYYLKAIRKLNTKLRSFIINRTHPLPKLTEKIVLHMYSFWNAGLRDIFEDEQQWNTFHRMLLPDSDSYMLKREDSWISYSYDISWVKVD